MPDLSPLDRVVAPALFLLGLACFSGCQHAIYTGVGPSARSFYEDPDFRQTYIGFDLNFVLDDPAPHVPAIVRPEALP